MLSALILVLFLAFMLVLYLILAPFYIEVNTHTGMYRLRLQRVASLRIIADERILIETNILGFKRRSALTLYQQNKPAHKAKQIRRARVGSAEKLIQVLRSFRITIWHVRIDTGDMQLNGLVYPLFMWLSWYTGQTTQVSFTGRTEVVIQIENSIARMSRAYLKSRS